MSWASLMTVAKLLLDEDGSSYTSSQAKYHMTIPTGSCPLDLTNWKVKYSSNFNLRLPKYSFRAFRCGKSDFNFFQNNYKSSKHNKTTIKFLSFSIPPTLSTSWIKSEK
ncbi:hypothetical protein F0562_031389 [Nyssa sinensis]|uniref:Uncharacterized protein n=1 Tax=Nyssa sinensis TaxID=561372 RepID=A0A5J5AVS5_9ASTE|nr:hypothetical protein F0562_031389 [Nyssa sinensis]